MPFCSKYFLHYSWQRSMRRLQTQVTVFTDCYYKIFKILMIKLILKGDRQKMKYELLIQKEI